MEFVVVVVSFEARRTIMGLGVFFDLFCEDRDLKSKAYLYLTVYTLVSYLTWETTILALVKLKQWQLEPCVLLTSNMCSILVCVG